MLPLQTQDHPCHLLQEEPRSLAGKVGSSPQAPSGTCPSPYRVPSVGGRKAGPSLRTLPTTGCAGPPPLGPWSGTWWRLWAESGWGGTPVGANLKLHVRWLCLWPTQQLAARHFISAITLQREKTVQSSGEAEEEQCLREQS